MEVKSTIYHKTNFILLYINTLLIQASKKKLVQIFTTEKNKKLRIYFKVSMDLSIDFPTRVNSTSNDGNTERRFFKIHEFSEKITGIDEELIFCL